MKADRLKKLKNKALERNPNEFHFHMINSRLVDGVHQELVKPMDPRVKDRVEKKEELLKRYNRKILQKRLREQEQSQIIIDKKKKPKRIVFNQTDCSTRA